MTSKSKNWYKNDKCSFKGNIIDNVTLQFGLQQMHILDNSSSFTDLIFTSQANLLIESGGHSSLHSNCYHQIIYLKFDLQDFYPPSYLREVWHYKDTKTELIRYSIAMFDWEKAFSKVHGKTTYE